MKTTTSSKRMEAIAAMFEAVRLRKTAVGLACAAACAGAMAQDANRFNNLPLISELPADAANCVTSDAQAIAYANSQWAQTTAANPNATLSPVQVYQCSTQRTVSSTSTSDTLKDHVLGNILTVTPSGTIYYTARQAGTYEKMNSASPSPAPAPTAVIDYTNYNGTSPAPAPAPTTAVIDYTNYNSAPAPAPAPTAAIDYTNYNTAPAPAPAPTVDYTSSTPAPAPAPAPVASSPSVDTWIPTPSEPTPVLAPAPAPAPVADSGNCLWTNTCGGTENTAETWGPVVWSPSPAPAPAEGGGSGWSSGTGYWEQP